MNACTFTDTTADRFLAGVLIESEMRRGATHQELIDLGVRYEKWDFVRALQRRAEVSQPGSGT